MKIYAEREHEIACGHRVVRHESKCRHLHGHNYLFHFTCEADELDSVGRVIDFSVIKSTLCQWLEDQWDHKFLAWHKDELIVRLVELNEEYPVFGELHLAASIVWVPFNPTAENMAKYMLEHIGPEVLRGTGVRLVKCTVNETRKCQATAML